MPACTLLTALFIYLFSIPIQHKVWSLVQQAAPLGSLLEIQIDKLPPLPPELLIQNQKVGEKDGNRWAQIEFVSYLVPLSFYTWNKASRSRAREWVAGHWLHFLIWCSLARHGSCLAGPATWSCTLAYSSIYSTPQHQLVWTP